MDYKRAIDIIRNASSSKFNVVAFDGRSKDARLFVSTRHMICEFNRNSTRRGQIINIDEIENLWKDIIPIKEESDVVVVRKFMEKVVNYLSKSGLWENIKNDYIKILSHDDNWLENCLSLEYSKQRELLKGVDASFHVDSIIRTAKKGIVSINYLSDDKEEIRKNIIETSINDNKEYNHTWRKGYDNSVYFSTNDNGLKRGYYSTEYKGCGNGHYYFALDERHAIFCETD